MIFHPDKLRLHPHLHPTKPHRINLGYSRIAIRMLLCSFLRVLVTGYELLHYLCLNPPRPRFPQHRAHPKPEHARDPDHPGQTTQADPESLAMDTIPNLALAGVSTLTQLYEDDALFPPKNAVIAPNKFLNDHICLHKGDITKLPVDAIVNAAKESLLGGGGVDGAIHSAAGPGLLKECRTLGGCDTGSAKITDAYRLPCRKVIHAVGPVYSHFDTKESEAKLTSCYLTSLKLAVENGCRTIAFSCISTGFYGYPSADAAPVACDAVRKFLLTTDGKKIDRVIFVLFQEKDIDAYHIALP